jgi:acetolactate synthase-1/2/3 large subunit
MKLADYVADFLAARSASVVFAINGAGNIALLDAVHRHRDLTYLCPHHEQAGVMAAITYARLAGRPGVMLVTGGPGAVNTITGIADAYLDSMPVVILAGQESSKYLGAESRMRGKGVQGLPMTEILRPITKYAATVTTPSTIRYHLERAFHEAYSGRPGPVFVDIAMDCQSKEVDPDQLERFTPPADQVPDSYFDAKAVELLQLLHAARRPVLWAGHGLRAAGAVDSFHALLDRLPVPCLVAWNGADLLHEQHPCYAGRAGTYGQRAANFIVQNSDLVIGLGTRLAIPQIGYEQSQFARAAKKVVVEIDPEELAKFNPPPTIGVLGDVGRFVAALQRQLDAGQQSFDFSEWSARCRAYRSAYPPVTDEQRRPLPGRVNSYHFIDRLSEQLDASAVIATDMGTSLTCTHAAIRLKRGQRLVTSTGLGEMGFGLPGAIGACLGAGRKPTVFIGTEGSLMMNIQELQTVVSLGLPLRIFILNNNGYLTIRHTARALFGDRMPGCGPESGVTFPDLEKVAHAFGLPHVRIDEAAHLDAKISAVLAADGPIFCQVMMPEDQFLGPKTAVRVRPDGTLFSPPLEDLAPFLPREELVANMIVPPLEEG